MRERANSRRLLRPLSLFIASALTVWLAPIASAQSSNSGNDSQEETVIDEIVAKVNSEVVTLTDLNGEILRIRKAFESQYSDPAALRDAWAKERPTILRNLIINKMILQKADELGVGADIDEDVNRYIQGVMEENGIPDLETFRKIMRQQNLDYQDFRSNLRQQFIIQAMRSQFVFSKITVLTPEIEEYYNDNLDKYTEKAEVELAEILFLTEGKKKDDVRSRAAGIRKRVEAGEDFETLARDHSDGNSASRGGRIGKFKSGQMAQELESAAFGLDSGQCTDLIETDYGFVILKVLSKSEAKPKPLEEVRESILRDIRVEKAQPFMETFLKELRDESYVFVAPKYREQFELGDLI